MHLVHSQVTISFQDMSITQRRKSPVYQFFNLWNSLISYFSKFLTRYKESEYKLMLSFFSVHFSPFSNFNNKSDNTNFSYHLNLSSLLSLYHPRITIVAGHVIPTLRSDGTQLNCVWLTDTGLKLPIITGLPFCLIPPLISLLYITFFKLF